MLKCDLASNSYTPRPGEDYAGEDMWTWVMLLLLPFSAQAEVYRCGNTYSHEPCKGGRTVDVTPPLADPAGPSTQRIYLCRRSDNALFWAPDHCHNHGWRIERTETVPARVPWEQQIEIARSKRNAAAQLQQDSAVPRFPLPAPQQPADSRSARCGALDGWVKELDRMGRAGSLHYDLEWVRRERKAARDEQFRLRC